MSTQALMRDIFHEEMMEDLDRLPANAQEWIKGMQETFNEIMCTMPNALRHVPDSLKTKEICEKTVEDDPWQLKYVPDHLKTQEMCNGAVEETPYALQYVPDCFITQEMCEDPAVFFLIPDRFKTEEMCKKAVEVDPWQLKDAPDHFKTQKMCDKAARDYPFSLQHVPDWFVTQGQIDLWYDDKNVYDDNMMIEWYKGYKKRKAQKASIKKELMPTA